MNTTISLGRKRLLQLAAFMDQLEQDDIDMKCWFRGKMTDDQVANVLIDDGTGLTISPIPITTMRQSGFVACALGWACMLPDLYCAGLTLTSPTPRSTGRVTVVPTFGSSTGFDAASSFFGINISDAVHLFHPRSYDTYRPSPLLVANRVRQVAF